MDPCTKKIASEEVPCELCGSRDYRPLFQVKDYERGLPGIYQIVRCCQCKLVFLNPRPSQERIGAYYTENDWYRASQNVPLEEALIFNRSWRDIQAFRCKPILSYKQKGRILDIGCGDGLLLKFLSERGWESCGIEVSPLAAQYAVRLGLDVREQSIENTSFSKDSFDVVSFFGSIEHLNHPLETLRKISPFLKEDGILYLGGTPNFDSFERKLFGKRWMHLNAPRHFYHFTPDTMERLLKEAGYRPLACGVYSDEGGLALGYAESLRHLFSDWGVYPPKRPDDSVSSPQEERSFGESKVGPFFLNKFHVIERAFFVGLGKIMDKLGRGGLFWVIAKKA